MSFHFFRDRLHSLQRNQEQLYQPFSFHNNSINYGNITPDRLSVHDPGRVSPASLLDEIVISEGTESPLILKLVVDVYGCNTNVHVVESEVTVSHEY